MEERKNGRLGPHPSSLPRFQPGPYSLDTTGGGKTAYAAQTLRKLWVSEPVI